MKKLIPLLAIFFLSFNMFSQMSLVPGQPNQTMETNKTAKANDNIAFVFYGYANAQVYVIENGLAEEIFWEETPSNFNPLYRGQIRDKYYFFSIFGDDGFLYEYNHISKNTRKIPFPEDYSCANLQLLTDKFNDKIYLSCGMSVNGDTAILSFDGTNFESFDSPQNYSIFREDFLFANAMDEIFIWYYEDGNHNNGPQLYGFDGSELNHIPNPSSEMLSGNFGVTFEDHILLPYLTFTGGIDIIYSLYKYDGSNLVEIPGLSSDVYHEIQFYKKEDKVYISLNNFDDFSSILYEYDGNSISEIFNSTFYNPEFLTEFNGNDMFSLFDNNAGKSGLYAYNGTSLEEITTPEIMTSPSFSGILNNQLYLKLRNTSSEENELYSYSANDTEVQPVTSIPSEPSSYGYFSAKTNNNNFLLQAFKIGEYDYSLYAQDTNEQFQKLDPDNYILDSFEFQLGDKIYYSYYDSNWDSKLWVWDGVLSISDFNQSQNNIIIHPNPATDYILADIPNTLTSQNIEVSLFSIDGKVVSKQEFGNAESQIKISLENLGKGIYILELKTESATDRKKLVKK